MTPLLPADHFLIMCAFAFLVSAFFAVLWREEKRGRLRLFGILFGSLVLGGLAVAWLMYPFPK
jgi:hypothetical protein